MDNRIKELRRAKGVTQQEIATMMGITQNNFSYWENGKVKIDSNSLDKLGKYFNVSVDYLLKRTDVPFPTEQPRFLTLYNSLSPIQQEKVIAFMEGLLA